MILALIPHTFLLVSTAELPRPVPLPVSLERFQAAHGANWQAIVDMDTGFAEFVHGGGAALGGVARTEDEARHLAGLALDLTAELHGARCTPASGR